MFGMGSNKVAELFYHPSPSLPPPSLPPSHPPSLLPSLPPSLPPSQVSTATLNWMPFDPARPEKEPGDSASPNWRPLPPLSLAPPSSHWMRKCLVTTWGYPLWACKRHLLEQWAWHHRPPWGTYHQSFQHTCARLYTVTAYRHNSCVFM